MPMTPGSLINSADTDPYPHRRTIQRDGTYAVATMVLVDPDTLDWALVQHHVSGWTCLATGSLPGALDADVVVADVAMHYGDGFDHLPREQYAVQRPGAEEIHTLRTVGEADTYCGRAATSPYTHIRKPGRYEQHCIKCTRVYRAEHYGRCPVETH